jgi:hypothetical protein
MSNGCEEMGTEMLALFFNFLYSCNVRAHDYDLACIVNERSLNLNILSIYLIAWLKRWLTGLRGNSWGS